MLLKSSLKSSWQFFRHGAHAAFVCTVWEFNDILKLSSVADWLPGCLAAGCLAGWLKGRASLVAGDSDWANYLGRLTAFSAGLRLGGILSCCRRRGSCPPPTPPASQLHCRGTGCPCWPCRHGRNIKLSKTNKMSWIISVHNPYKPRSLGINRWGQSYSSAGRPISLWPTILRVGSINKYYFKWKMYS